MSSNVSAYLLGSFVPKNVRQKLSSPNVRFCFCCFVAPLCFAHVFVYLSGLLFPGMLGKIVLFLGSVIGILFRARAFVFKFSPHAPSDAKLLQQCAL